MPNNVLLYLCVSLPFSVAPPKTKAIVAYREADELFASVDELLAPSHH